MTIENTFNLNGIEYDGNLLSEDGKKILELLNYTQEKMNDLEMKKSILIASRQHLIDQLKCILPEPSSNTRKHEVFASGAASDKIPSNTVEKPENRPVNFPKNIPDIIRPQKSED